MTMVSINPRDQVEGGGAPTGLLTVTESRFVRFDYGGRSTPVLTLRWMLQDAAGETHDQHYSAGDITRLQPSSDGKSAVAVEGSGAVGLMSATNAAFLLREVVNAGWPESRLSDDVSIFDGLQAIFEAREQPTRAGLAERADGRKRTLPIPSKVVKLPWEAGPATNSVAAPVVVPAAGGFDAQASALTLAGTLGGSFSRADLAQAIFAPSSTLAQTERDMVSRLIFANEFVDTLRASGFKVDGETITPA
jgi:hypothetical protein